MFTVSLAWWSKDLSNNSTLLDWCSDGQFNGPELYVIGGLLSDDVYNVTVTTLVEHGSDLTAESLPTSDTACTRVVICHIHTV
jgi:hypothetical protein